MSDSPQTHNNKSDLYHPFTKEKVRGMVASVISGLTGNSMNLFGQSVLGLNPFVSTFLFMQLGGNLVGYILDIVLAKETFKGTPVRYSDLIARFRFMLISFSSTMFFKFIITVIIDAIIVVEMLRSVLDILDANNIQFKFRNEITAGLISFVTFVLWVNALRFNWAYAENENPVMNIIMVAWLGIMIMAFCAAKNIRSSIEGNTKNAEVSTNPWTFAQTNVIT